MTARRAPENPIITPGRLRPSRPDMEIVGVFNPGAIKHETDVVLLLRVAEAPVRNALGEVAAATFDASSGLIEVRRWARGTAGLDISDPRIVLFEGQTWLTSISHFRVARSKDGIHFDVKDAPAISPATELESYGVEDPRITFLDGTYWINYSAVSHHGISTALASTRDFRTFERHGIIFPPNNRDVAIFPEQIGGRYVALHRPMPDAIGEPAIWIGWSHDLMSWGDHGFVAGARRDQWDDLKIGGGAVPFRVNAGGRDAWLAVYHGVSRSSQRYSLGALLLDSRNPTLVIARSRAPILEPAAPYEQAGFYSGVVFTCGVLAEGDQVRIYYGAADGVTAVADVSLEEILAGMS